MNGADLQGGAGQAAADSARSLSRMSYSDIGALRRLRGDDPDALEQAAAQFESLFVDIWLSSMRKAGAVFGEGSYLSSSAVQTHQEMLDHQYAVHVAESGGIGLRDVLMRQLARGGSGDDGAVAIDVPATSDGAPTPSKPGPAGPTAPAGGVKDVLFEGAEDFVRNLEPLVQRIAGGIHPVAVLAQAALETGWGSAVPHDSEGRPSFNLFGIKSAGWDGPSVDVTTLEHRFGRFVRKVDSFRAYADVAEAVKDYVTFLKGNERYAGAMDVAQDPAAFADALQEAGYATDPGYADKLKALQRQIANMLGSSQAFRQ